MRDDTTPQRRRDTHPHLAHLAEHDIVSGRSKMLIEIWHRQEHLPTARCCWALKANPLVEGLYVDVCHGHVDRGFHPWVQAVDDDLVVLLGPVLIQEVVVPGNVLVVSHLELPPRIEMGVAVATEPQAMA